MTTPIDQRVPRGRSRHGRDDLAPLRALPVGIVALVAACGGGDGGDGGNPADGGNLVDDGGLPSVRPSTPPTLAGLRLRQVGRFGEDLRVEVSGSDPEGDVTSAEVGFLSVAGQPLPLFDGDGDGRLEAQTALLPLDSVIAGANSGASTITLRGFIARHPGIGQVRAALVDATGARSPERTAMLETQPVRVADAPCDPRYLDDRCSDGLGCKGTPRLCRAAEPPVAVRAMYLRGAEGAAIQVEGTDPDDDVSHVRVEFLDGRDQPVSVDLDGDGRADGTEFLADAPGASSAGHFFHRLEASLNFTTLVAKVALTVRDRAMLSSARTVAALIDPPQRNAGQPCDPRGFDVCRSSVCLPGVVGANNNRCVALAPARASACNTAMALDPERGMRSARGETGFPSLYDPPAGCANNDPVGRPERVVKLTLRSPARRLVLSTVNNYTNFDTVLYLLPTCDAQPALASCADDRPGQPRAWLSRLELADLAAGTYYVVVDGFLGEPGRFQLDVGLP